jgi:MHS family proline/betaine transporter-like MFS transporter
MTIDDAYAVKRADAPAAQDSRRRAVMAAIVGNTLEWYDFGVYGFLAVVIGKQFFATADSYVALLQTFAAFGVGFVARPLGSALIGRLGDVAGRKAALLATIAMMAFGTLAIGLVPGYRSIGIAAPTVLVSARLLQGLAAGGEWGNAAAFLSEWAGPGRRGLCGGLLLSSVAAGLLLGSGICALLSTVLTADELGDWGWRVPFLVGAALIPMGIYMRRNVDEAPAFRLARAGTSAASKPHFILPLARATCVCLPLLVASYMATVYMPTYAQLYGHIERSSALWANTLALVLSVCLAPLVGHLSDHYGRRPSMMACALLMVVLSYPLYALIATGLPFAAFLAVQLLLTTVIVGFTGSAPACVTELFSTSNRCVGSSLANALAAVLGGFTPFISTWLIHTTGLVSSPSVLVILAGAAAFMALLKMNETAHAELA